MKNDPHSFAGHKVTYSDVQNTKTFDIYTDIKRREAADPHTGGARTMNVQVNNWRTMIYQLIE